MIKRRKLQPWHWMGDDPSEQSGVWWQEAGPTPDDYVHAVRITACSDAGGPCNLYAVDCGSVYFSPDNMDAALSCVGIETGYFAKWTSRVVGDRVGKKFGSEFEARLWISGRPELKAEFTTMPRIVERHLLVHAFISCAGMDVDHSYVVQVGKKQEMRGEGWNPEPTDFIRGGSSIKNYVKRSYC